jgi:hypothetical protein
MKNQLVAVALLLSPLTLAPTTSFAADIKTAAAAKKAPLGDLSKFQSIVSDTLKFAKAGDLKKAEKRITDMETKWDAYENSLKKKDKVRWNTMDLALDRVLKELRASKPNAASSTAAVQDLLTMIESLK